MGKLKSCNSIKIGHFYLLKKSCKRLNKCILKLTLNLLGQFQQNFVDSFMTCNFKWFKKPFKFNFSTILIFFE
jgi:hypothetical protein